MKESPTRTKKKEKPLYNTIQNCIYLCKGAWESDKLIYLFFGAYTIISAINPFIGILFPKFILDELLTSKRAEILLLLLAVFFISSALFSYFIAYLRNAYFPRMVQIRFYFIRKLSEKCMTMDFQNTEDATILNDKETVSRCVQNNNNGIEGVLHKLFSMAGNLIAFFGYSAIVVTLNWYVLLYLVLNVIVSYLMTFWAKRYEHSKKDEISDSDRRAGYAYHLMYDFSYGKDLRIYGLTDWIAGLFAKYKGKRLETHKEIKKKYFSYGIVDILLLLIREGVIYAYLVYKIIYGGLPISNAVMYFSTIASFAGWFQMLISDLAHIRAQNLDICDFRAFLNNEDSLQIKETTPLPQAPYVIEFKKVSFHYPNSEAYVYKNLNLKIPFGQKLAIVGHNGAGKTTFIKLLCRLYDVTEGEILLNGINIKKFDLNEYYKLFSAVFQEVKTMAFPVSENVAIEEKDLVDETRVSNALKYAGVYDKVNTLKNGIHNTIQKILDDDGIELSGGENQKISIARALYKNGPIMVLDEPTAALDPMAEYQIYLSFNAMVQNKTAIYISHRLASTLFCDQIAMFEHGELVEYGTHKELIQKNGKYADMFETQAKYYKESEVAVG
ncbi:MAG: transporter, ATP-binding protein [Herbinix sp.]|jgi:ATP-binding cassette subfamily C protein|nr:transporter, ATP-binding protein [Herbinix sp.]